MYRCGCYVLSFCHSPIPRHTIQSGVWNNAPLAYHDGMSYTIMDAIDIWYQSNASNVGINFRDVCRTPHCNQECPETFLFSSLKPKEWPMMFRVAVGTVVVAVAIFCILLKVRVDIVAEKQIILSLPNHFLFFLP